MSKKLSDEEIWEMIKEFETLNEEARESRLLGEGAYKKTYDVPGKNLVIKLAKESDPGIDYVREPGILQDDYINAKKMSRIIPSETPILVKRPGMDDLQIQRKLEAIPNIETLPQETKKKIRQSFPNSRSDYSPDIREAYQKELAKLPQVQETHKLIETVNSKNIADHDLHTGNFGVSPEGKVKANDFAKFSFGNKDEDTILNKTRDIFSDKMNQLTKNRIFRQVAGALPLAGTAMAISSGDASAAAEELPGEIPFIGQAYEAIKPGNAGDSMDDRTMIAERDASANYAKSGARKDALNKIKRGY